MELILNVVLVVFLIIVVLVNIYPIIAFFILYWYVTLAIVAFVICTLICKRVNPRFYHRSIEELNAQPPLKLWHIIMIVLFVACFCSIRNRSAVREQKETAYEQGYENGYSDGYLDGIDEFEGERYDSAYR